MLLQIFLSFDQFFEVTFESCELIFLSFGVRRNEGGFFFDAADVF